MATVREQLWDLRQQQIDLYKQIFDDPAVSLRARQEAMREHSRLIDWQISWLQEDLQL
jgi:hypothetical protein